MANTIYLEFEVTLLNVEPPLWRRFLLRQNFSFENLHGAIQMACGWNFSHLYEFRDQDGNCIARAEEDEDDKNIPGADSITLKSYFTQPGQGCRYNYDFGDYWEHGVRFIQKVTLPERFVQRLTGGEGMFPPEDCGGIPGYEDCVKACRLTPAQIKILDTDEREDLLALKGWLGAWRLDGFDMKAAKTGFER